MQITLEPHDYATAFRLLATTSRHHTNIAAVIRDRVAKELPTDASLLDVGAGPGTVAREIAPLFRAITLIEPNPMQLSASAFENAEIIHDTFENARVERQYDLVLCSHVLYHVALEEWPRFVDDLLARTRPGGHCVIVLGAPRGQNYEMHRDFTDRIIESSLLQKTLTDKGLPFEVVGTVNELSAETEADMLTLCRFFVLEDCFTKPEIEALDAASARALDQKIRAHAAKMYRPDRKAWVLGQDDDVILLEKPI